MQLSIRNLLNRITILDELTFTKHLAIMIKSGIRLSEAIKSLADQTKNPNFKQVLTEVLAEVENGQSLEKALSKHSNVFNSLYLSLVRTGEKSGKLEENLEYLALQLKKSYEFRKKIEAATLYPKIVLVATIIIGASISLFVLPQLIELFESLDVELPVTTKILLFIANLMKNWGILIIGGFVLLYLLFLWLIRTPQVKPIWHKFLVNMPILGRLVQNIELTSICRNLGIMLKSGLTVTSALETQRQATENLVFKEMLVDISKSVERGKKISEELNTKKYRIMPTIVPKMIAVGENTGKLDETFIYLGDFFEEEVDDATKNLSNTLEPILLLAIGAVVAFVAMAIISPIYSLTGSIKK